MNTHFSAAATAAAALAGWLVAAAPAQAHGRVQWSITIGSPGVYYYDVQPRGVIVSPRPKFIYGAPPSAFAPPPAVIYVQPAYPPPVLYVDPYGRPIQPRHPHWRHGGRHHWDDGHHRGGHGKFRR